MNVNVFIFMRRVRSHNKSWSSGNISVAFFFYVYISISMDIIFEMQAVWDSLASIIWGCEGDWGGGRGGVDSWRLPAALGTCFQLLKTGSHVSGGLKSSQRFSLLRCCWRRRRMGRSGRRRRRERRRRRRKRRPIWNWMVNNYGSTLKSLECDWIYWRCGSCRIISHMEVAT